MANEINPNRYPVLGVSRQQSVAISVGAWALLSAISGKTIIAGVGALACYYWLETDSHRDPFDFGGHKKKATAGTETAETEVSE